MKQLHVQIQSTRSPDLDASDAINQVTCIATDVRVTEGDDDGPYVNLDFRTEDILFLWKSVRKVLHSTTGLARAAIVICEGENGWDDYLLLHHFNPHETRDVLGE